MTSGEAFLLDLIRRGLLQLRDDGTIWRSFARSRSGRLRTISPVRADHAAAKGYRAVCITEDGKAYRAMAHRLIWMAANGPLSNDLEVNHINGIRDSNILSNLEPLTHGQNQTHSYRLLNRPRAEGVRNGSAKLTLDQVALIRAQRGLSTSRAVGRDFGVSHFAVQRIWNGTGWRVNGMPPARAAGIEVREIPALPCPSHVEVG